MPNNLSQASDFFHNLPLTETDAFDILRFIVGVDNPLREQEWLDYKSGTDDNPRATLSKALSGFANSGGGIVIWGIQTKQIDKYDVPDKLALVPNPAELAGKLESWKSGVVDPPVRGVQIRSVRGENGEGFVVAHIPESQMKPHQAKHEKWHDRYFIRIGHQMEPASQSLLRILFYPQFNPQLSLTYMNLGKTGDLVTAQLYLRNTGVASVAELEVVATDQGQQVDFVPNQLDFTAYRRAAEAIGILAKRTLHPEFSVNLGMTVLKPNRLFMINVFGKDMKPFRWRLVRNAVGDYEIVSAT